MSSVNEQPEAAAQPRLSDKRLLWAAVATALVVVINLAASLRAHGFYPRGPDQFYYAGIARNIVRGDGLQAQSMKPIHLGAGNGGSTPLDAEATFPAPRHQAGWPLLLAAVFKLFGPSDAVYQWTNVCVYVATIVFLYLLGTWMGGPAVGLVAVLMICCWEQFFAHVFYKGLDLPMCLCIVAGTVFLVRWKSLPAAAAAALTFALAFWLRITAVCFFPLGLLALYGARGRRRVVRLVAFAGVLLASCAVFTLVARSLGPAAKPAGRSAPSLVVSLLGHTEKYPQLGIEWPVPTLNWRDALAQRDQIVKKLAKNLRRALLDVGSVIPLFVLPFVVAGWWTARRQQPQRIDVFVAMTGVSWLAIVAMASLTVGPNIRYFFPVLLLLTPLGAAGLLGMYRRLRVDRGKLALALPAVVAVVAVTSYCIDVYQAFLIPPVRPNLTLGRIVADLTPPDGLVATSVRRAFIPRGACGWHADRKALRLPRDGRKVQRILDERVRADLVILDITHDKPWFKPADPDLPVQQWLRGYRLVRKMQLQTTVETLHLALYVPTDMLRSAADATDTGLQEAS